MKLAHLFASLTVSLLPLAGFAQDTSEYVPPRELGCVPQAELSPETTPPELARVVRACVGAGDYRNAFAVWLSFNSYALYDQQRVKDESAHMVLQDLYSWTFAGYPRRVMEELRAVVDEYRDRDGAAFLAACETIVANGPPAYRPTYMIATGMWPLKNPEDWRADPFEAKGAWLKAVSDINGCPAF